MAVFEVLGIISSEETYSILPYSGSHIENWHSILRNGLVNASYTKLQVRLCPFPLSFHSPLIQFYGSLL